jgi:hypothetical protein
MNRSFNMTIELSPEDVKEAIVEYINRNVGEGMSTSVGGVTLDVDMHYEDRPCGSSYPQFKKATVKVKKMGPYQDR